MSNHEFKIIEMLRCIQEDGGEGNIVIFITDIDKNYYIQVMGNKGEDRLLAESVSNKFLDGKYKLKTGQIQKLEELGWKSPGPSPNFYREWTATDDDSRLKIAQVMIEAFVEGYGWNPKEGLQTNLTLG